MKRRVVVSIILLCGGMVWAEKERTTSGHSPQLSGSPTLQECFTLARANNAPLKIAVERITETRFEESVSRSRLLPHLDLVFAGVSRKDTIAAQTSSASSVALRQRLLEFGALSESEIQRLRNRRQSLYEKEEVLLRTLSDIRSVYFSLRISTEQRTTHDTLLAL